MKASEYSVQGPAGCNRSILLALVTDLHEHDPGDVLRILGERKPDYILAAGDIFERVDETRLSNSFFRRGKRFLADQLLGSRKVTGSEYSWQFLRRAREIAPVYMALGNHEMYLSDEDLQRLAELDIVLLNNSCIRDGGILFCGIPSYKCARVDHAFLRECSRDASFTVLLSHHPEYREQLNDYPFDLILSGHCHGGQMKICGKPLYAPGQGILPKYGAGQYGNMIVSSGCANTLRIPRLGNEEEVDFITLN